MFGVFSGVGFRKRNIVDVIDDALYIALRSQADSSIFFGWLFLFLASEFERGYRAKSDAAGWGL